MTELSLIAAVARNDVIGRDNRLPWHLPEDLRHFKQLTMGKPMIMGRRTWESLPGLLPGRPHIVLSRDPDYTAPGCRLVTDLDAALAATKGAAEAMVIGGEAIYRLALPRAKRIHLTRIELEVEGDAFFPTLDPAEWQEQARSSHRTEQGLIYHFCTLVRNESISMR